MSSHHLEPSIKACHQGYLEATLKPVPALASRDAVAIDTVREAANAPYLAPNGSASSAQSRQCAIQALDPMIAKKHVRA